MSLPTIRPYRLDTATAVADNVTRWALDPHRAVLLVHDMQEHFVGAFERRDDDQLGLAVAHMRDLVDKARAAGVPVVYTAQPPAQDPADRALLIDFWGPGLADARAADIISDLTPTPADTVLTKWRYSAFFRSELQQRMRDSERDQLVITGIYAHIGCLTTALVAFMEGIQTFFVTDAMADFTAADHEMAARYVARRCGQVMTTAQALTELDRHRTRRDDEVCADLAAPVASAATR